MTYTRTYYNNIFTQYTVSICVLLRLGHSIVRVKKINNYEHQKYTLFMGNQYNEVLLSA